MFEKDFPINQCIDRMSGIKVPNGLENKTSGESKVNIRT